MKKITTFEVYRKTYYIAHDGERFWGIESKYVGEDGKLNTVLNGITGNIGKSMNETLNKCYISAKTDEVCDRDKLSACDIDELLKVKAIVEEAMEKYPY